MRVWDLSSEVSSLMGCHTGRYITHYRLQILVASISFHPGLHGPSLLTHLNLFFFVLFLSFAATFSVLSSFCALRTPTVVFLVMLSYPKSSQLLSCLILVFYTSFSFALTHFFCPVISYSFALMLILP